MANSPLAVVLIRSTSDKLGFMRVVERQFSEFLRQPNDVVAEEPTEALSISHDDLKTFLETDPRLAGKLLMSMLKALCHRLRETDQTLAFTRFMMRQDRA